MIERDPNKRNGRPIVEGAKIGVIQLHEMVEHRDVGVDAVAQAFGDKLSVEEIEEALEYYDEHEEEMRELEEKMEEEYEEAIDS